MRGILVTKLRYIGDVLLATPALRLLRRSFPDAHITMLVNKGTEDILRHNPHVDRVLTSEWEQNAGVPIGRILRRERDLLKSLRAHRYDASVDIYSGERAAILSFLSGVRRRIAFEPRQNVGKWLVTEPVAEPPNLHIIDWGLLLLKERLGLDGGDRTLELPTGADDDRHAAKWLDAHDLTGREFVALHGGARYAHRRWAPEKWAQLSDAIRSEFGLDVVIVGSRMELDAARRISAMATHPVLTSAGDTTVLQAAALLRRARVLVGVESSPMHIASAVGTPVVALFSAAGRPAVWGPWGTENVVLQKPLPVGTAVHDQKEADLENLTGNIHVKDVTDAVGQILARPRHERPTSRIASSG